MHLDIILNDFHGDNKLHNDLSQTIPKKVGNLQLDQAQEMDGDLTSKRLNSYPKFSGKTWDENVRRV